MNIIMRWAKEIVGFIVRYAGIYFIVREVICRNKVTIIFYHDPKPEIFEGHIRYLSRKYTLISIDKLVDAIKNKDWSRIPTKSLVVTFDDGHVGNYALLSIFQKYDIYPMIYICSDVVNTNRKFWWKTGFEKCKGLKEYSNNERLKKLNDATGYLPTKEYNERQSLNLAEMLEMSRCVGLQSHTMFHPILTKCADDECLAEISCSKLNIERMLSKEVNHFAYPNGDYSARELSYVKGCKYKSARTLDIGWNDVNTDPYRLKTMIIDDDASVNKLCAQICGIFAYFRYAKHGSFRGMHPDYL